MKERFIKLQAATWAVLTLVIGLSADTLAVNLLSVVLLALCGLFCARMACLNIMLYEAMKEER